jgi:hypothetical protein
MGLMEDAGFREVDVQPRTDCFTSLAQLLQNVGNAMKRAPDGRDTDREAARLLSTLADRLVGLAGLDVNHIFPLGFTGLRWRASCGRLRARVAASHWCRCCSLRAWPRRRGLNPVAAASGTMPPDRSPL